MTPSESTLAIVDDPVIEEAEPDVTRIDRNFMRLEHAIVELRNEISTTRASIPRRAPKIRHRTGRAARFDPDDARATPWLVAGQLIFVAAALTAAFSGQIAMAPYTTLPEPLYILVPIFIDLPIILLAYMVQVFRRRKQSTWPTWTALIVFTTISSAVQVIHVLSEFGVLTGAPLTIEVVVGTTLMGLAPWIVLFAWEQLTRLLVRPAGEKKEPSPPARKRPTRKKATR